MSRSAIQHLLSLLLLSLCSVALANTERTLAAVDKSIRLRDYQQAVQLLKPLLKQRDATAQFRMAGLYRAGKGVKQDADKARDLYEKSALNGHAEAQYALASILERRGSDWEQIRFWYQESANQGYALATRKLKSLKDRNKVVKVDKDTIFDAIRHNKIDTIKKLLDNNQNLNIQDSSQRSSLLVALLSGHEDMSSLLLTHSKQLDTADKNRTRPIHAATRQGFHNIIEKLLSRQVNINAQDALGNTALMIAVTIEDNQTIELLLIHHADTSLRNKKQLSAIDLAHTHDSLAIFKKFGINTSIATKKPDEIDINTFEKTVRKSNSLYPDWPLLSIASHLGEKRVVQQLLANEMDINAVDPAGYTALHRASANGQLDIVILLISKGARINATNNRKETPLALAAAAGQYDTLKYLLTKSADTTLLSSNNSSALSLAIRNQHQKSAALLVNQPLDGQSRHRALLITIPYKMEAIALELSKHNSLLAGVDDKQRTALWLATESGLTRLVSTLLENKDVRKTINLADKQGYTPLARATLANHISIVKMLIKNGANTQALTLEKNSLLMLAVVSGHTQLTEYYIEAGADTDHRDLTGDTAIMLAAAIGRDDIIELLIEAGADLQVRNHDDLNAYQIALDAGHEQTAALIKSRSGTLFNLFN